MLEALELLDRLGAEPAAALARARLRELGVRAPRRSRADGNAAGLTPRQLAVLALLREGRTKRRDRGASWSSPCAPSTTTWPPC